MPLPAQPSARLLIVEDNELDALLLLETLRSAKPTGLEMVLAGKVSDALQLLDQGQFNVILTDLSLPDSSGFDTFSRLYAHAPETPIILLTGNDNESLGLDAVRAGAQEYIVKGTMNGQALWRVISYAIERQGLERAVRDSEKRYKRLLDSVTDYIYTVKVEHGNPVATTHGPGCFKVTGYSTEELDRNPLLGCSMVHEEDRKAVLKQAALVLAGKPATLEHRIIHQDGSVRWVRHTPVLRRDENDEIIAYDALISDITERKQTELALHRAIEDLQKSQEALKTAHLALIQAEKMETVGRMAAGVAHEVQNPLQILLMSLDYLSQRMAEAHDPILTGVIDGMRDAAKRADLIIRGLLDFSHSDSLSLNETDVNALVEKALLPVRPSLVSGHIELQADLAVNLPQVPLDEVKIEQVLVNLFTNAIDAMPNGGTLVVRTSSVELSETRHNPGSREAGQFYAGDTVVIIDVEDDGTGIAPDALRKIYDPFFTTKATGKGTGLGLAIVKRILDLHGGTIEICNRETGGTHCRLMFKTQKSCPA